MQKIWNKEDNIVDSETGEMKDKYTNIPELNSAKRFELPAIWRKYVSEKLQNLESLKKFRLIQKVLDKITSAPSDECNKECTPDKCVSSFDDLDQIIYLKKLLLKHYDQIDENFFKLSDWSGQYCVVDFNEDNTPNCTYLDMDGPKFFVDSCVGIAASTGSAAILNDFLDFITSKKIKNAMNKKMRAEGIGFVNTDLSFIIESGDEPTIERVKDYYKQVHSDNPDTIKLIEDYEKDLRKNREVKNKLTKTPNSKTSFWEKLGCGF